MKIIAIEKETTKEIVAYTVIEEIECFGLKFNELIERIIQIAIDDELLEENVWYKWYESDKIPVDAIRV